MIKEENIIIEDMKEDDLDEVVKIEQVSFPDPWSYGMFKAELSNSFSRLWVARDISGGVTGYICFWLLDGEAHLLDLAIHPLYRRKGIASRLIRASLDYCKRAGVKSAYLEVRESNEVARRVYERFGFRVIYRRSCYYKNPKEDACVMGVEIKKERGV